MRIIGGRFKGRALAGPKTHAIRPTSDRLRETIFNILAHAYNDPVPGARVLDLFCGSGAMGLEALSRGADCAVFVDEGTEARSLVRANVETLGLGGVTRLFRRDATRMGAVGPNGLFSIVFCDPPYGQGLAGKALESCAKGGWLAPNALAIVEEAKGAEFVPPAGFSEIERRTNGVSTLVFARFFGFEL